MAHHHHKLSHIQVICPTVATTVDVLRAAGFPLRSDVSNWVRRIPPIVAAILRFLGVVLPESAESVVELMLKYPLQKDGRSFPLDRVMRGFGSPERNTKIDVRPCIAAHKEGDEVIFLEHEVILQILDTDIDGETLDEGRTFCSARISYAMGPLFREGMVQIMLKAHNCDGEDAPFSEDSLAAIATALNLELPADLASLEQVERPILDALGIARIWVRKTRPDAVMIRPWE